ncbi:MAG: hypothetical protein HUU49_02925 [Candidatus Buchananbacteria bacterium]|nr:hypothetical protein [Candidatus Buchananbacteria bacterium]
MLRQDKTLRQEVSDLQEEKVASSKWFFVLKKTVTVAVIIQMISTLVVPAVLYPLPVLASNPSGSAAGVQVSDPTQQGLTEKDSAADRGEAAENLAEREGLWIQEWLKQKGDNVLKHTIFAAAIEALNNLLNQIAYDTATWLASGGEGQQPLFYTEGWGAYLQDAVDGAAGEFLNDLAGNWVENINLCEPNFSIKLGLAGGISNLSRPRKPDCSVSQMVQNWESFVSDEDFLDRFEVAFQSGNNDVTIGLEVFNKYYQKTTSELVEAVFGRATGSEFKGIISKISNIIKTPGTLVEEWAMKQLVDNPSELEASKAVFGDLVLNPIATFLNTLVGKLFQRIFEEGLADDSGDDGSDFFNFPFAFPGLPNFGGSSYDDLYTGQSGSQRFGGRDAAELRFLSLFEAGQTVTEQYDVLTRMAFCSDPDNPGPDECVITQSFRSAVEQELTLKEAIKKGLINGDAPFGFTDYDPSSIYNGIPYRSIVILRAHRIVPVGWELAAKAVKQFDPGKTFSLNQLIAEFENPDSVYYGLIDPQWVLKSPSHICKAEGYGPKIVYESTVPGYDSNQDNDYNDDLDVSPSRVLARAEYCADYQTCLEENDDGTCKYYGYCSEEKRIWNLQGSSCPDYFNTCQTFQSSSGQVVSYLENSLDYNGCNIDNAGCQWYCQEYNAKSDVWTCLDPGEGVMATCNRPGGCNLVASCVIPEGSYSCADASSSAQVTLNQSCGPNSEWWNGTACVVATSCTEPIPYGGVSCTSSSCDGLTNQLPNASFEQPYTASEDANKYVAQGWSVTDPNQKQYWQRVTGSTEQVYPPGTGSHSIRYYVAAASGSHKLKSDSFSLPVDDASGFKFYTLSGRVFNRLNAGTITLEVEALNEAGAVLETTTFDISNLIKNSWQYFSFEFKTFGNTRININVNGSPKSGTAWFDEFKVSESCIANPVRLTLAASVQKDQSKLHLDRDAQTCNQEDGGCSKFIRTLPNIGTNLVVNSSFEDWTDVGEIPPGWSSGENHPATETCDGEVKCERSADSPIDNYSVKLTNDPGQTNARDFETLPIVGMRPNTTYRVSFWAKTDYIAEPENGTRWYSEILSDAEPNDSFCKLDRTIACFWPNGNETCQSAATGTGNPNDECLYDYSHLKFNGRSGMTLNDQWQRIVMDPIVTRDRGFDFKISFNNNSLYPETLYLDGLQVEEVDALNPTTTAYKDYGKVNDIYLKKPPASLDCQGYSPSLPSPYVLDEVTKPLCVGETMLWREDACDPTGQFCCHQIDAPECYNYAYYCQPQEVGCEAYRPLRGGTTVPGVVGLQDYCPLECVGYESYKQSSTLFENQESLEFFIPDTAVSCNASQAGCDEFTNLDEVALGGEGLEHYKYLRLCEKPNEASCQSFFAWQGSEETGFQLKIYSLSAEDNQPKYAIDTAEIDRWPDEWCSNKTLDGNGLPECCNEADDLEVNPFCKELISVTGETLYRIYDNTISCSLDCHPFRKTRLGETDLDAEENCNFSNGRWDAQNSACVYQAIPNEGISCSADAAGCREYRGNAGANIFTTYFDNFEDGDLNGWHYGTISSEALTVTGHSIAPETVQNTGGNNKYNQRVVTTWGVLGGDDNNPVTCSDALPLCDEETLFDCFDPELGECVARDYFNTDDYCTIAIGDDQCGMMNNYMTPGRTYVISFWAKSGTGSVASDIQLQFSPGYVVGTTSFGPDWNYYKFGPFVYDTFQDGLRLRLVSSDKDTAEESVAQDRFFVDNIEIKEVQNYEYVIKNSWETPSSCDTNPFVDPPIQAPQFMLGCAQYFDSYNRVHNLKSFTSLCREEAIGCEALIDTQNSSSPFEQNFNASDGIADVKVPADNLVYMTTRPEQQCGSDQKGCQAVGLPQITVVDNTSQIVSGYQTAYLINDPDKYDSILCGNEEVGCQEWQSSKGFTYFKNPGARTCEYRKIENQSSYGWFKIGSSSQTPDCPLTESPVGGVHPGPDSSDHWYAGICPGEFSSCTQFIDSASAISKNLLFNGMLDKDFNEDNVPDGWDAQPNTLEQKAVSIEADTIYVFGITTKQRLDEESGTSIEIVDCPGFTSYDHSVETLSADSFRIPPDAYQEETRTVGNIPNFPEREINYSVRFTLTEPRNCKVRLEMSSPQTKIKEIFLRKAGVDYVLADSVDKLSCNGVVDLDNECVLFNDRSQVNYNVGEDDVGYLTYDGDTSGIPVNNGLPIIDCAGPCDSNVVLKVKPDRTCESWLYCKSAAKTFDENGGERTECLSLGLCNSLDENGNCDSNILVTTADPANPTIDNRSDYYQDTEQISNLSGYSQAGFQFANAAIANDIVHGYFPYAEMTQEGSSALVTNGNFETVFDKRREPIGWSPYINNSIGDYDDSQGWQPYKYIVEDDLRSAIEGGYLKLSTSYQVQSGEIDVEKDAEYILSGWINTFNLSSESIDSRTRDSAADRVVSGQICLTKDSIKGWNPANQDELCKQDPVDEASELCCLAVDAGSDWTHLTYRFKANDNNLKIYLQNDAPPVHGDDDISFCRDNKNETGCDISGYALYDEISLQPVLRVQQEPTDVSNDFINRTCRVYPEASSLACRYYRDKTLYSGRDGYCLTTDPANPSQCVQWWPVDSIAGEGNDEFFAPDIPAPLYYCMETGTLPAIEEGYSYATFDTSQASASFHDEKGTPTEFLTFNIPEEYQIQYRFPYVDTVKIHYDYTPSYYQRPFIMDSQELSFHIQYPIISGQANPMTEFLRNNAFLSFLEGIGLINLDSQMSDSGFVATLRNTLRDQIMSSLPAWAEPNVWIGYSDWDMQIRTQDSEKNGVVPVVVYVRGDVSLMLTVIVGIIAVAMGGAAAMDLVTYFSTAYDLIQSALPVDFIGVYLHTYITFTEPLADNTTIINSLISGISLSTSLAGAAPQIILAVFQVISDGLFAFDVGDWNDIWDVFTSAADAGSGIDYPSQEEFAGWFGVKFGPYSVFQVVTDRDEFSQIADLTDPIPEINGDILGGVIRFEHPGMITQTGMVGKFYSADESVTYCKRLVRVVDASGISKAWLSRVFPGSKYVLADTASRKGYYLYNEPYDFDKFEAELEKCEATCDDNKCNYVDPALPTNITCESDGDCLLNPVCNQYQSSDFEPFGSAVPPTNSQNPGNWDTRETAVYRQPLFYEPPLLSIAQPHQARMGELHQGADSLKNIFLKSYGVWDWQEGAADTKADDYYVEGDNQTSGWDVFDDWEADLAEYGYCDGATRGEGEVCRQRPTIRPDTIKVNGTQSLVVKGAESIQLDFTVVDDPNQLPIVSYSVFWGDGNVTAVSGSRLRDRPNEKNPFTSYHTYDHWEMQRYCASIGNDAGQCDTTESCTDFNAGSKYICCPTNPDGTSAGYCKSKIRIKVRDNWNAETCCLDQTCAQNTLAPESTCDDPKLGGLQLNKYIPMPGEITVQQ